ncbi:MAG: flagellar hook-length control protein FliK [Planctomycetota bacterium]
MSQLLTTLQILPQTPVSEPRTPTSASSARPDGSDDTSISFAQALRDAGRTDDAPRKDAPLADGTPTGEARDRNAETSESPVATDDARVDTDAETPRTDTTTEAADEPVDEAAADVVDADVDAIGDDPAHLDDAEAPVLAATNVESARLNTTVGSTTQQATDSAPVRQVTEAAAVPAEVVDQAQVVDHTAGTTERQDGSVVDSNVRTADVEQVEVTTSATAPESTSTTRSADVATTVDVRPTDARRTNTTSSPSIDRVTASAGENVTTTVSSTAPIAGEASVSSNVQAAADTARSNDEQPSTPALGRLADVEARVQGVPAPTVEPLVAPDTLTTTLRGSGGEQQATTTVPIATSILPDGEIDENAFAGRIVRGLRAMINQQGGTLNMRLTPPELGDVRIAMSINRDVVSAQFFAQSPEAQALLDKHLGTLRASLEQQGMTVEKLQVHHTTATQSANASASGEQDQDDTRDASDGQSRGRQDGDDHDSRDDDRHERPSFDNVFNADASRPATVETGATA